MATKYMDKDGVIAVINTADHKNESVVFEIDGEFFVEEYADFIKRFRWVVIGD